MGNPDGERFWEFEVDLEDDEIDILVASGILRPRVVYEFTQEGITQIFKTEGGPT